MLQFWTLVYMALFVIFVSGGDLLTPIESVRDHVDKWDEAKLGFYGYFRKRWFAGWLTYPYKKFCRPLAMMGDSTSYKDPYFQLSKVQLEFTRSRPIFRIFCGSFSA